MNNSLERLIAGEQSAALNLGTGVGHSVRDVIASVERVGGKTVNTRECARRPGDPPALVADASAAAATGWAPRYTDLDDIVATAWDWHVKHGPPAR